MRPVKLVLAVTLVVSCALAAYAQSDAYSQIRPLEAAVNSGSATSAQKLDLARLYIDAGRLYEATKLADAVLAEHPGDADASAVRDRAAKMLRERNDKNVSDAEARARAAGASDQDRLTLANAYYDAGSYTAAADAYARLPQSALDRDARLRRARSLAWTGRLDAAEQLYSDLLKEQSTPELQLEYGRLLSWMGASKPAVDSLTQAYDALHSEDAVVALANAKAWSGDRQGAIQLLNDYDAAHPEAAQARQLSAQLAASPDLRLERIDKLVELQPYNLALQVERARLQNEAGRYAESLRTIDFIHQHTHKNLPGLDELEKQDREQRDAARAKLDEERKAFEAQNNAMASSAQNPDQVLSLAKGYTGVGDYREAERLYDRYLRTRPDDFDARVQYARVLSWDRRWAASERQYDMLLEKEPNRADIRYERALVLSYDSEFPDAVEEFSTLTDLSSNPRGHLYPDIPAKAHYNIGQIYRWHGWNDHAVMEQNSALALDSSYQPARQELDLVRHVQPASGLGGTYTYATDSNDFTLKRIDLDAQKWTSQRMSVSLSVGRHEFSHFDQDVYANAVSAGLNYRLQDNWRLRAHVGGNFYDSGLGDRPFFGAGAEWLPNLESRFAFDYNHYDLIYDVFNLRSLGEPISPTEVNLRDALSINDFRGHYDFNSGGYWSWLADGSYGFISDSNRRTAAHGLVALRVWKAPFVAVKGDGRYLAYDFRTNRYWSPTSYHSLAGVLQVGDNIRQRFYFSVEGKYGKAWEGSVNSDIRAYEASVTVPITDVLDAVGDYGYGKSGRLDTLFGNGSTDFTNYWQRHWYVGVRVKGLFSKQDRQRAQGAYYYDATPLSGSPVLPPETH